MRALLSKLIAPVWGWSEAAQSAATRHLALFPGGSSSSSGTGSGSGSDSDTHATDSNDVPLPRSFGEGFERHLYQLTDEQQYLQQVNAHPLDSKTRFEAAEHKYFYEDAPVQFSVTEVVGMVTEKFDRDWAIRLMKKGRNWPRPEYTQRDGAVWSDDQIKDFWSMSGMYTRNRGTWMHYNIERYWNKLPPLERPPGQPGPGHASKPRVPAVPEMTKFHKFREEVLDPAGVTPWRTEWRVCNPSVSVAGSIDFVGKLPDGTYCIVDWKRSQLKVHYGKKKMLAPLGHLDGDQKTEYFLQLNIYRSILQTVYGIRVSRMILGVFHPHDAAYVSVEVPILDREAEMLLEHVVELGKQHVRLVVEEEDRA